MTEKPATQRPTPALMDLFVPDRTLEIAFWANLAAEYGRVVIDWHCGTGELATGLAARNFRVVGVDPDPASLEVGRTREQDLSETVMLSWVCHEPRLASLPGAADFAIISGSSLGQYLTEEQQLGLFTNIFNHLRPGGALGIAVPLAPASGVMHNTYISGPLRRLPKGIFARRVSSLKYNHQTAQLTGTDDVLVRLPDNEQRFQDSYVRHLYTPDEMFGLLRRVGFTAIGMWGGWERQSLRQASGFFVARAVRPNTRSVGKKFEES